MLDPNNPIKRHETSRKDSEIYFVSEADLISLLFANVGAVSWLFEPVRYGRAIPLLLVG